MARKRDDGNLGTCKFCDEPATYKDPRPEKERGPDEGGGGLCPMHYGRALRRSPNLKVAGRVRDGSRSEKVQVSCEPEFKKFLIDTYGKNRVSERCLQMLKKAVGWKPPVAAAK